jgi:putative membrane protein
MSDLNDPRVFFAAERTLMAWTRTSLTLLAFGFMVERFGLFLLLFRVQNGPLQGSLTLERGFSYWAGIGFMLLGSVAAALSVMQYRKVLRTLKPVEIPAGYRVNLGAWINLAVAALGILLTLYLFRGVRI